MTIYRPFAQLTQRLFLAKDRVHAVFKNNPRFANAATGFLTFSVGDILVQRYECKSIREVNWKRSLQLGGLGVVMNGVFLVSWYRLLDRLFGHSLTNHFGVSLKVIADQVIFAPFSIMAFFGFSAVIRHTNVDEMYHFFTFKMENNFWKTFFADCSIWPLANVVTFRFITLIYRPTFTASVQLLWQAYMSAVAAEKKLVHH